MIMMTLIFLSLDGHLILVELVVKSYELMPLGGDWLGRERFWDVVTFGSYVFAGGLAIALPVGFALFGLNLLVGVLTRAAPQLNIFAVGLPRSEEHTSELQSLMRISYAVFCLKKKKKDIT